MSDGGSLLELRLLLVRPFLSAALLSGAQLGWAHCYLLT